MTKLTILMPCLNEEETLGACILKARSFLEKSGIIGEILIADNGSTDLSSSIATSLGARVISISDKGYGRSLMAGIKAAEGQWIIMGDSDDSYDFERLELFIEKLEKGFELVMGNRFLGGIMPKAMPPLHRYLGNPVLSGIGRLFFKSPCKDFHCGLRAFDKKAILDLDLKTGGMEFASEMVVKATLKKLKICEVPTTLKPDGRSRPPHLRSLRDGWRHLRFMMLYCPRWLFLYPGIILMGLGSFFWLWALPGKVFVFDVHSIIYSSAAVIVGFQVFCFGLFTKAYASSEGLLPKEEGFERFMRSSSLEVGLVIGFILILIGLLGFYYAVNWWVHNTFSMPANPSITRVVVTSAMAISLGIQVIFSSFFLSILRMKRL